MESFVANLADSILSLWREDAELQSLNVDPIFCTLKQLELITDPIAYGLAYDTTNEDPVGWTDHVDDQGTPYRLHAAYQITNFVLWTRLKADEASQLGEAQIQAMRIVEHMGSVLRNRDPSLGGLVCFFWFRDLRLNDYKVQEEPLEVVCTMRMITRRYIEVPGSIWHAP